MGDAGLQRIDHYTIIRLLNENPISSTYLGKEEQRKKRYVIIKIFKIPLSTTPAQESFLSRAKQLKKLKRSNIAEILSYGIITDTGNSKTLDIMSSSIYKTSYIRQKLSLNIHLRLIRLSHFSRLSQTHCNMPTFHRYCMGIFTLAISFLARNCELQILSRCHRNFFNLLTTWLRMESSIKHPSIYEAH